MRQIFNGPGYQTLRVKGGAARNSDWIEGTANPSAEGGRIQTVKRHINTGPSPGVYMRLHKFEITGSRGSLSNLMYVSVKKRSRNRSGWSSLWASTGISGTMPSDDGSGGASTYFGGNSGVLPGFSWLYGFLFNDVASQILASLIGKPNATSLIKISSYVINRLTNFVNPIHGRVNNIKFNIYQSNPNSGTEINYRYKVRKWRNYARVGRSGLSRPWWHRYYYGVQ